MTKKAYYDQEGDILFVHKGYTKNDPFAGNVDSGDVILDISKYGKVRGIEILNASNFLKDLDVDDCKQILDHVKDITFESKIVRGTLMLIIKVYYVLNNVEEVMRIPYSMRAEAPIACV